MVRGHWRKLPNPKWVGHGPTRDTVIGKTWIHDYFKGDESTTDSVILERQPDITIKIKQPLSYGRDIIEAHRKKGGVGEEQFKDTALEKPTSE